MARRAGPVRLERGLGFGKTGPMTEPYAFTDNLGYLLNRCADQIAARFAEELEPFEISLAQWGAMLAIHESGQAAPSIIADRIGADRGATTRLLSRMQGKGLIVRRKHEGDGRGVIIALSAPTQAFMPELIRRSKRVNAEVLAVLPDCKASALLTTLAELNAGLRESGLKLQD